MAIDFATFMNPNARGNAAVSAQNLAEQRAVRAAAAAAQTRGAHNPTAAARLTAQTQADQRAAGAGHVAAARAADDLAMGQAVSGAINAGVEGLATAIPAVGLGAQAAKPAVGALTGAVAPAAAPAHPQVAPAPTNPVGAAAAPLAAVQPLTPQPTGLAGQLSDPTTGAAPRPVMPQSQERAFGRLDRPTTEPAGLPLRPAPAQLPTNFVQLAPVDVNSLPAPQASPPGVSPEQASMMNNPAPFVGPGQSAEQFNMHFNPQESASVIPDRRTQMLGADTMRALEGLSQPQGGLGPLSNPVPPVPAALPPTRTSARKGDGVNRGPKDVTPGNTLTIEREPRFQYDIEIDRIPRRAPPPMRPGTEPEEDDLQISSRLLRSRRGRA